MADTEQGSGKADMMAVVEILHALEAAIPSLAVAVIAREDTYTTERWRGLTSRLDKHRDVVYRLLHAEQEARSG